MREKVLSLGQSVCSFASIVRYPKEGRPKFLTCQKFNRPSDSLSGEVNRFSFPPVHCTNTAQQTMHDKAEIRPDSKKSQNSAQNRIKIAQCMPGLKENATVFPYSNMFFPQLRRIGKTWKCLVASKFIPVWILWNEWC